MIYSIILSNTKETIRINTDEELNKIIQCVTRGDKLVICKHGIFNPSYMVGITAERDTYNGIFEYLKTPEERAKKEKELFDEPSPFAKALSKNITEIVGKNNLKSLT